MSHSMPPVPPANRTSKGPATSKSRTASGAQPKKTPETHTGEQGDSANIKQNTTSKGGVHGNRMK